MNVVRATLATFGLHVGVMEYNAQIKERITNANNYTNKITCVLFYTLCNNKNTIANTAKIC
jgi:hypothetical protein